MMRVLAFVLAGIGIVHAQAVLSDDSASERHTFATRLTQAPDDPEALYHMGRLTSEDGPAGRYFERLLKVSPSHELADDARLALAQSAYASPLGLFKTARRHYRRLVEDYPGSPHVPFALYRLGKSFMITGQPDSAAAYFARVEMKADPLATFVRVAEDAAARALGRRVDPAETTPVYPFSLELSTPSPTVEPTGREGAGRFWIQAGAFRRSEGAHKLAERLRLAHLSVEQTKNDRGLIVLRVGPFSSREEAVRIVRHLKDVEHIDAMVLVP
ncbi:MAG: hypothetical protein CME26_13565 [Gemmatimonadetes bacterium]|nr:hypothetical protein [Gemmatimonadota bacterium]|tara:strand:- start:3090 stop:3905 length:816 start_codon:yes stop_codon:yes gene_type:complete